MERLKLLRKEQKLSQEELGRIFNVHQTAISHWEQGRTVPDAAQLTKLAQYFNVSIDYLLGTEPNRQADKKGIRIPVLGRVQAGIPIEAIEEIMDYEEITPEMASQGEYFALLIQGDSMEPRMKEGDVVIVRKQEDVDSGDIAVVIVNGHDATIKRLIKRDNGLLLQATNPAYEPMFFTPADVRSLPVVVVGRVVELRVKF